MHFWLLHRRRFLQSLDNLTITLRIVLKSRCCHSSTSLFGDFNTLGYLRSHHVLVLLRALTNEVLATNLQTLVVDPQIGLALVQKLALFGTEFASARSHV